MYSTTKVNLHVHAWAEHRSSSVAVSLSALAHCPQRLDVNGALLLRSGQRRYKVSCWQLAAALDCSNASFVTFCIALDDALALSLSFCSAFSVPSSVFLCSSSLIHMLFFSPCFRHSILSPLLQQSSHSALCYRCVVCERASGPRAAGEEENEQEVALWVMWPLQAWWQNVLPPRHAVSAAVAACSVIGEGVGLLTYLYSCPLSRKRNKA